MGEPVVALGSHTILDDEIQNRTPVDETAPAGTPITDFQGMQILIANCDADRERTYRLRYQVYCVDNDFEPAAHHPRGRETDAYDDQSVHCLLVYRDKDNDVGTARLILPCKKEADRPLPTPQICASGVLAAHSHRIPANSTAELSRFAVPKARRRPRVTSTEGGSSRDLISHTTSSISLGLMRGVVAMAHANGITHLYALMDPALLRMLRRLSIHFEKLGPAVDFHGPRQPCFCDLGQLLRTTRIERPDVWAILTARGMLWPTVPAPSDEFNSQETHQ